MYIRFKGSEREWTATSLTESKLFDGDRSAGWLLSIALTADERVTGADIDAELTPDSVSEIAVNGGAVIRGYSKVNQALIRYGSDASVSIDIQLTKFGC